MNSVHFRNIFPEADEFNTSVYDSNYSFNIHPPNIHGCTVYFQHLLWVTLHETRGVRHAFITLPSVLMVFISSLAHPKRGPRLTRLK